MNQTYQQLVPRLAAAPRSQLVSAQLAWIEFRDAECRYAGSFMEGGSAQPLLVAGCLISLTQQRHQDLKKYLRGQLPRVDNQSYTTVDQTLNQVYQQLNQRSEVQLGSLENAELHWMTFRDRACDFEQSSGSTTAKNRCLVRLTVQQITQLRQYLDLSNL